MVWRRRFYSLASLVASTMALFGPLCRLIVDPFARLWRLASLRSRVAGLIPVTTQFDGPCHTAGRVRLHAGDYCRFGRGVFFETQDNGRIELGSHVRINMGSVLVSYSRVAIGDRCLIGEYVSIRDADHGTTPGKPIQLQSHCSVPVEIRNNVWIGRGAVILKGVTIGSGATVGANAVVTEDVPAGTTVGGVPARVLRSPRLTDADEQTACSLTSRNADRL